MDIGAPKSVIGQTSLSAIFNAHGRASMSIYKSDHLFRLGDDTVTSLGGIELYMETPTHNLDIPFVLDVVPVDVPALVVLDVLGAHKLLADTAHNR